MSTIATRIDVDKLPKSDQYDPAIMESLRPLRESGLPYRKANARRLIERTERRVTRPHLNLFHLLIVEGRPPIKVDELDAEFLSRAENNPSLNLIVSDFQTIKGRKSEIQYLIKKHFFPQFDLTNTLEDTVIRKEAVNSIIASLKKENPEAFNLIYGFRPIGIGPGEALLYFIYDKATLGGGSVSSDVVLGSNHYEVKAVKMKKNGDIIDFKLGGTVPLTDVMKKLTILAGKEKEITGAEIEELRAKQGKAFKAIEDLYAKIAYESYFSKHKIIFFNNAGTKDTYGTVLEIMEVKAADIRIERVTAGTIKPLIKTTST